MHSSRRSPFECYDDLAVDVLELLHRGRGGRRRRKVDDDDDALLGDCGGYGGDFFYSFVKFQAAQLNHLAHLGIAHAEYARRAMEALYGGHGCGARSFREPDLLFVGKVGETVSRSFTADNRHGPEDAKLEVSCSRFRKRGDDDGFSLDSTPFNPAKKVLKKNEQVTIEMKLLLDAKKFQADSKYFAVVEVELADETIDKLLVRVDVKPAT